MKKQKNYYDNTKTIELQLQHQKKKYQAITKTNKITKKTLNKSKRNTLIS